MDEIEKLRTEIKVLNKRVADLESLERRRKAFKGIRMVFKIITYLVIAYGVWYAYNYVTESIPNQIENGIKNIVPNIF